MIIRLTVGTDTPCRCIIILLFILKKNKSAFCCIDYLFLFPYKFASMSPFGGWSHVQHQRELQVSDHPQRYYILRNEPFEQRHALSNIWAAGPDGYENKFSFWSNCQTKLGWVRCHSDAFSKYRNVMAAPLMDAWFSHLDIFGCVNHTRTKVFHKLTRKLCPNSPKIWSTAGVQAKKKKALHSNNTRGCVGVGV